MERSPSRQLAPASFSFQGRREEERPGPSERGTMAFPALLKDKAEQGLLPPHQRSSCQSHLRMCAGQQWRMSVQPTRPRCIDHTSVPGG